MQNRKFLVVGGGLVGLAAAYRITEKWPDATVTLLEKEDAVCRHQSGHNSGVMHCGLNYKPGSQRALLAVRGVRQMTAFCRQHGIRHDVCGKLVVAANEAQRPRLQFLLDRGTQNGLRDLELLDVPRMRAIEPHAGGIGALRVPEEGITDYPAVAEALARILKQRGSRVVLKAGVSGFRRDGTGWVAQTSAGEFPGDYLLTCGGLQSDRLARMAGEQTDVRIIPFRGDYFKLKPASEHLVRNLIYPVPDPSFPFLGVHFTRLALGGIECGPNAALAFRREGYSKTDIDFRDLADSLTFPGLWNFLRQHPATCWEEQRRTFSARRFAKALQVLVPEVTLNDIEPAGAGIRAQAMRPDGTLVDDFAFVERANALHVVNAPSPAATASLAIGEEIVARIAAGL